MPHLPQLSGSVSVSEHRPPQSVVLPPQAQLPPWQNAPAPRLSAHCWSTLGSLSTIPSQSSSFPSQTSGAYEHSHTLPACPASGAHVQPAMQALADVHVVVQTSPVQPGPPPEGCPTGWQIMPGQFAFLVHGWPVSPAGGALH
jgi:hypothetical protein